MQDQRGEVAKDPRKTAYTRVKPTSNTHMTERSEKYSIPIKPSIERESVYGTGIIKKVFIGKRHGYVIIREPSFLPDAQGEEAHWNFSDLIQFDSTDESKLLPGWELEFKLEKQQAERRSKFCDYKAVCIRPKPAMVLSARIIETRGTQVIGFCQDLNRRVRISHDRVNSDSFERDERLLVKIAWDDLPTNDDVDIPSKFASSMKFQMARVPSSKKDPERLQLKTIPDTPVPRPNPCPQPLTLEQWVRQLLSEPSFADTTPYNKDSPLSTRLDTSSVISPHTAQQGRIQPWMTQEECSLCGNAICDGFTCCPVDRLDDTFEYSSHRL